MASLAFRALLGVFLLLAVVTLHRQQSLTALALTDQVTRPSTTPHPVVAMSTSSPATHEADAPLPPPASSELPPTCTALGPVFSAYLRAYISQHSGHRQSHPRLIYNCQSNKLKHFCGGMGDRFRGMVTTFFLALVSNRTFQLYHPVPVPLEDMLEPPEGLYDWRTTLEAISSVPVNFALMRLQSNSKFMATLARGHSVGDLRVQSNSATVDPWVHGNPTLRALAQRMGVRPSCNLTCYFSCLYGVLFRPSKVFADAIGTITRGRGPYLSLQVRVGGDWAKGMRIKEPYRTHPTALPHYWGVLKELLATVNYIGHSVFVSSDSLMFVNKTVEQFGASRVFFVGGDAYQHTDTQNLNDVRPEKYAAVSAVRTRDNYMRTLLSHYLLGDGAHVVMAQSGFGDTAFWRTRKTATALFMDMGNHHTLWQHHLEYPADGRSSVVARPNRIFNAETTPVRNFYSN